MELTKEKKMAYAKRILKSRMRILVNNGFYGLLLMHMRFELDESIETAATDGRRILFAPAFLDELADEELDFILMHEILHVVLQHCLRTGERDNELFNLACDIVVNSTILHSNDTDMASITLKKYGESIHTAPDGTEGYELTAEQVYGMLTLMMKGEQKDDGDDENAADGMDGGGRNGGSTDPNGKKAKGGGKSNSQRKGEITPFQSRWDDHSRWKEAKEDETYRDVWVKHFEDACEAILIRDPSNQRGTLPKFAERLFAELRTPQKDWKKVLNDFIQEEVVDYSFTPPDRRFDDSVFFLPDFNEKDDMAEDILFMIDTSGSMSDEMITSVYSEVKGAIDQFGGKLKGWLGFFDAAVIEPKPFSDDEELKRIKPAGGGGTDFHNVFEYVKKGMSDHLPAVIILLTDGYAPFPEEKAAMGIPVLWVLNNEEITPPWGRVTRISS